MNYSFRILRTFRNIRTRILNPEAQRASALLVVLGGVLLSFFFPGSELQAMPLGQIAIQDRGRLKPLDSFARESMQLIYGKKVYNKKEPAEFFFACLIQPDICHSQKLIEIRLLALKNELKLDPQESHFSAQEILNNTNLSTLLAQSDSFDKGSALGEAIKHLHEQISTYQSIVMGLSWRLIPPQNGDAWHTPSDAPETMKNAFHDLMKAFASSLAKPEEKDGVFPAAVDQFARVVSSNNPALYPALEKLKWELTYNRQQPFLLAWIFYLCALLLILIWGTRPRMVTFARILMGCGFLLHTYGFALRVYLSGRAPVSNMYESVIWVAWGAVFFAAIFGTIYRRPFIYAAGLATATLCLILADLAPSILDPSLQPLMPVLRSNFWLVIHVLVITISYAAFLLAFGLSLWGLTYFVRDEEKFKQNIKDLSQIIYRTQIVGVILLAAGIILGGVWADYSWGRFWGWDPKETWALIALLGYLALLHGRLAGWFREFGTMVGSVISFLLVLMAWYGVNYILGAGLHSYGFGAGGIEYVASFVAIQLLYLFFVALIRNKRMESNPK